MFYESAQIKHALGMSGHLPSIQQLPLGHEVGVQAQLGADPAIDLNSDLESFFKFFIII